MKLKHITIILLVWISATSLIQMFVNPKMTQTELFLEIPRNIILKFKK